MYVIESSLSTSEPIMLLDQSIGYDPAEPGMPYIDGALFQRELLELDNGGYKTIKIYINSPGGNVVDGFNIVNCILKSKTPVDTYNIGIAASMGGIIFMAGRKRIMMDYSSLMVHNPHGGDNKMLNALRQSTLTILCGKAKLSEDEMSTYMSRETWFAPSECLEKGLCTDIETTSNSNQKNMPVNVSARAIWKEAKQIQNNIFKNLNMENPVTGKAVGTSLIAAYLNLNADTTETAVLTEVKNKINALTLAKGKADDELAEAKKAMDKSKSDFSDMEAKYNALKKEKDDAEAKAKKDAEEAAATAKAATEAQAKVANKAIIAVYATAEKGSRIKAEEVEEWAGIATVIGIEKVTARIESLPLNKIASGSAASAQSAANGEVQLKLADGTIVNDPNKVPASAMSYAAKIMARANAKA